MSRKRKVNAIAWLAESPLEARQCTWVAPPEVWTVKGEAKGQQESTGLTKMKNMQAKKMGGNAWHCFPTEKSAPEWCNIGHQVWLCEWLPAGTSKTEQRTKACQCFAFWVSKHYHRQCKHQSKMNDTVWYAHFWIMQRRCPEHLHLGGAPFSASQMINPVCLAFGKIEARWVNIPHFTSEVFLCTALFFVHAVVTMNNR